MRRCPAVHAPPRRIVEQGQYAQHRQVLVLIEVRRRMRMDIRQIVKESIVSMVGLLFAAALLTVTAPVNATEVAWHMALKLTYDSPPNYEREGTAVSKAGERASVAVKGTFDVTDEKGARPFKGQWSLRFDDGSMITIQLAGSTDKAGAISAFGEFVSGTGRFKGITGKVTYAGRRSGSDTETDLVGSYSLQNK